MVPFDDSTHAPYTDSIPSFSESLVLQLQGDDPEAQRQLIDIYGPLVYRWCRRWLTPADACDVVQEVFLAVFRGIGGFSREGNGSTSLGWLRTITRRKVIDFVRKQQCRPVAEGGSGAHRRFLDIPAEVDLDEGPTTADWHMVLRNALDVIHQEVNTNTWQAFWLTTVELQTAADVARTLGITAGAVRNARFRVRHRLRELLCDDLDTMAAQSRKSADS